jgi:hypothetical protein
MRVPAIRSHPTGQGYQIGTQSDGVVINDDRLIDTASGRCIIRRHQSVWTGHHTWASVHAGLRAYGDVVHGYNN